jgi:hypothetical protein
VGVIAKPWILLLFLGMSQAIYFLLLKYLVSDDLLRHFFSHFAVSHLSILSTPLMVPIGLTFLTRINITREYELVAFASLPHFA